jgi:hypothetical protein
MMKTKLRIEHRLQVEGHTFATPALNPESAGEPIILLRGIGGSIRLWSRDQVDVFQAHGPCHTLRMNDNQAEEKSQCMLDG